MVPSATFSLGILILLIITGVKKEIHISEGKELINQLTKKKIVLAKKKDLNIYIRGIISTVFVFSGSLLYILLIDVLNIFSFFGGCVVIGFFYLVLRSQFKKKSEFYTTKISS